MDLGVTNRPGARFGRGRTYRHAHRLAAGSGDSPQSADEPAGGCASHLLSWRGSRSAGDDRIGGRLSRVSDEPPHFDLRERQLCAALRAERSYILQTHRGGGGAVAERKYVGWVKSV